MTVVELYWVLRRAYKVDADQGADLLEDLLDARELQVDRSTVVSRRPRSPR